MVSQFFVTEAENEYVIRANSAIMKCKIPSFVSEFVQVDQWVADDGTIYTPGQEYGMTPVDVDVVYVVIRGATSSPFSYFLVILISHLQTSSRTFFSFPCNSTTVDCSSWLVTSSNFYFRICYSPVIVYNRTQQERIALGNVFKLWDKHLKNWYVENESEDDKNFNGKIQWLCRILIIFP